MRDSHPTHVGYGATPSECELIGRMDLQPQTSSPFVPMIPYRIVRKKELRDMTGLSDSTIYNKLRVGGPYSDPSFPRQVRLGSGAVGWHLGEILQWIAGRQKVS